MVRITGISEGITLVRLVQQVTNTAALFFGPPAKTEQFDGTSWTEVAELNTERQYAGGTGPYTLALAIGGDQDPGITGITEEGMAQRGQKWRSSQLLEDKVLVQELT